MSASYKFVNWNRQKRVYDSAMAAGLVLYLGLFAGAGAAVHPTATVETLLIRGLGTAALLMLHVILAIGPLCRFSPRFLPLLYNRRHLGVTMFLVALAHGALALFQFHALGDRNPFVSLLVANAGFEIPGAIALGVLFLMAATSHDYWQHLLGPGVWKRLHMMVYFAYVLLIAHVSWGALRSERSPVLFGVLGLGAAAVCGLHLAAAWKERRVDRSLVDVGEAATIPEDRARVVMVEGERVAVFRYGGDRVCAVSNVCRHQNGPLGEGKVVDGCITCPWHGYQYKPEDGASPPPYTDRVPVYRTAIRGGRVLIDPRAVESAEPSRIGVRG